MGKRVGEGSQKRGAEEAGRIDPGAWSNRMKVENRAVSEEAHSPSDTSPGSLAAKLSAVERGAKAGIGPLSPLGIKVWHGESAPCASCGELVRRAQMRCPHCGQDLSLSMITKMQAHCGPWYVLEHVRPFPGVTLERLIRQIHRGVLTRTTIVRGPTTFHQWRFAAETPGLSKHLGVCWNCQAAVKPEDTYCRNCDVHLDRAPGELPEGPDVASPGANDLEQLNQAVRYASTRTAVEAEPRRRLPTSLVIVAIVLVAVAGLVAVVMLREHARQNVRRDARPPASRVNVEVPLDPAGS